MDTTWLPKKQHFCFGSQQYCYKEVVVDVLCIIALMVYKRQPWIQGSQINDESSEIPRSSAVIPLAMTFFYFMTRHILFSQIMMANSGVVTSNFRPASIFLTLSGHQCIHVISPEFIGISRYRTPSSVLPPEGPNLPTRQFSWSRFSLTDHFSVYRSKLPVRLTVSRFTAKGGHLY